MIKVNGEVIKIEHYPDGTQKLHIDHIFEWCCCDYNIDWRYEKEEELSSLIYITRHSELG